MAKVVALSGPQGGGKTTLLNGLADKGWHVDSFKVSREVQSRLGWEKLDSVLKDPQTMMDFQTTILEVKSEREAENVKRSDVELILTERSFADIAAYTQLWCWELVSDKQWSVKDVIHFMIPFADKCAAEQRVYDGNLILPMMTHIKWEADPHRAKQEHTTFISEQLEQFFKLRNPWVPTFTVTEYGIQERTDQANAWLTTL